MDHLREQYPQFDYIVINDGSRDATARICREKGYHLLDLPVNLGLAGGFQAGLKYAWENNYSYAIQFDGDGQHRPEYIQPMKEKMEEGYDIVIGSRFLTEKKSRSMRMLGSGLLSFAIRLTTGTRIKDPTSGMRMFSRKMIEEFALSFKLRAGAGYGVLSSEAGRAGGGGPGEDGRAHCRSQLSESGERVEIHD